MAGPTFSWSNGHVLSRSRQAASGSTYPEPRILYHNNGNGTFTDMSADAGSGITAYACQDAALPSAIFGTIGRLSAMVSNMNDHPSLLVNQARSPNHWIAVRTIGTKSNRDGIGARVHGQSGLARSGRRSPQRRQLRFPQRHARSLRLRDRQQRLDWIQVRWPGGRFELI